MNRTRLSLFYLASYLGLGGAGLLLAPQFSLHLLGAKRDYDPVFVRFSGMFMPALSVVALGVLFTAISLVLDGRARS